MPNASSPEKTAVIKPSIFTPEGSRFIRMHYRWLTITAAISGGMVVFIALITLIDIFGRSTSIYHLLGVYEICSMTMLWLSFIGVAEAQRRGANIRVDILTSRMKPKTREILLIFALLVGIFVFWNTLYTNIGFTAEAIRTGEIIAGIARPTLLWPVLIAVPIGCIFLLIQFVIEIGLAVDRLRKGGIAKK